MRWDVFEARIEELFHITRISTPEGRVRVPDSPVDPFEAFAYAADDEEERRYVESMRHSLLDLVEHHYPIQNLFTFQWDDGGMMGWETYLQALRLGNGGHLVYMTGEALPTEFFALIEGGTGAEGWSRFALDLIGTNGAAYGIHAPGWLPPGFTNHRADLMAWSFIRDGCRRFLDAGGGRSEGPGEAWRRLRDEVIGRALAPRAFSGYKPLGEVKEEGFSRAELTDEERGLILDNYLEFAYGEAVHPPQGPLKSIAFEDEEEEG
jgi:hypothetical protein